MPGKFEAPRGGSRKAKMQHKKAKHSNSVLAVILSVIFALIGMCSVSVSIYLCVNYANASPILLTPSDTAQTQVDTMMQAICDGDYQLASQFILGNPDFGMNREASDELGVLFWNEFQASTEYELVGECYATDNGLAQDITFTCLDLTSITSQLRHRSQTMLELRVQEAEDTSEIYDENNDYREDFVMDILYDAALDAIEEDAQMLTFELTVSLKYQDGQWWVIADKTFLDAISGDVLF